jgi:CO dehydrogenase/acetyl-CoA synthase gamma subunit (corrinoid Fe-S protein)
MHIGKYEPVELFVQILDEMRKKEIQEKMFQIQMNYCKQVNSNLSMA